MTGPLSDHSKIELFSETFYKSLIPMFWCNSSNFVMFNEAFVALSGYDADELATIGFDDLSSEQNNFNTLTEIHEGHKSREAKIVTWHVQNKAGKPGVYELRLTKLPLEEKSDYYYGVMRSMGKGNLEGEIFSDMITKLKNSLEASNQAVWEWYSSMEKVSVYDAQTGIFEQEMTVLEFDQDHFLSKVHPIDRQRVRLNWLDVFDSQDDEYSIEYKILNKNNEYIWVHSDGKVMERDSNGSPLRISGIIRNIHEQKKKEKIIMEQTQKLIDYAFMNSHLLRGPASSIIGLVDLLSEEYSDDNLKHLKDTALKLDERIHEINRMIESTEKETGVISAHIHKVSLICKDSLQSMILKSTVEDIDLEMTVNLNEDLDEYFSANEETGIAEVVILDEDSCDDIWSFLTDFEAAHPQTPVYILASRFDISMIDRLNRATCVHGIILKSADHHGLFEFLKTLNN